MLAKKMSGAISATPLSLEEECGLGGHRQRNPGDDLCADALLRSHGFEFGIGWRSRRSLSDCRACENHAG